METKTDFKGIIYSIFCGIAISALLAFGIILHHLQETGQRAKESFSSSVKPVQFETAPSKSQASIIQAIELFGIKLPEGVNIPTFDPTLADRGLTIRKGALNPAVVKIGSDAFASWGLLGSTLAHELEVHCRQNFIAIHLMDLAGADGTGTAEREAYSYELKNSKRFGLSPYDQDLIRSTVMYYYPQNRFAVAEIPSIKFLMAKLAIIESETRLKQITR